MQLELVRASARIADFNPRAEIHGNETEPAGDIKLELSLGVDGLAMFGPDLRFALFDEANAANGGAKLRNPKLGAPLPWNDEIKDATVTLHDSMLEPVGATKLNADLVLQRCKVNAFRLTPKEGGTTDVALRVQCHPDEHQAGRLCALIQSAVEVSIESVQGELPV